jgi:fucose permease
MTLMASSATSQLKPHPHTPGLDPARRCLPGFLVCGILMSFLAAILPAWGYHLKTAFSEVGGYFLTVYVGFLLSRAIAGWLLCRRGLRFALLLANGLACGGFLVLAFWPPAVAAIGMAGVLLLGVSAGLLTSCVLRGVSPLYERDRAGTVRLASTLFGIGCLVTALLVAGAYYAYTVRSILFLFAVLPGLYAGFAGKLSPAFSFAPARLPEVLGHLNEPSLVLFALLLFFQFGNEWSIAGWLSLFLIRRLGISPEGSLVLLALYWGTLLVGRIAFPILVRRTTQSLMLAGSILASLLGTVVLASTDNRFGAIMGILFVGAGFASVLPLVVEKTGYRFQTYNASLFDAFVSIAITGGFLMPWLLGYLADGWGIRAVMIAPLLGTCLVLVLIWLIMLEAKLSGSASPPEL